MASPRWTPLARAAEAVVHLSCLAKQRHPVLLPHQVEQQVCSEGHVPWEGEAVSKVVVIGHDSGSGSGTVVQVAPQVLSYPYYPRFQVQLEVRDY